MTTMLELLIYFFFFVSFTFGWVLLFGALLLVFSVALHAFDRAEENYREWKWRRENRKRIP